MKPRRVVRTGVGVVTPIGTGREQFWDGLQGQVSKVGPITRFDPSPFRSRMAGEVPDFRPADHIEARRVRRFDRFAQFGVAATRLAIADADLDLSREDRDRIGSSMGTALAGVARAEEEHGNYMRGGLHAVDPSLALAVFGGAASCNVAIELGVNGVAKYHADNGKYALKTAKAVLNRADVAYDEQLLVGNPAESIVKFAGKAKCDLVVMGSHGRSSFQSLFLGSVTTKVLGHAQVPVTIVR